MKKYLTIFAIALCFCNIEVAGQLTNESKSYDSALLLLECDVASEQLGKIWTGLETLSHFPENSGYKSWFDFANSHFDFDYVMQKIDDTLQQFQDSLIVVFIVTKNGKICNVKVKEGNLILAEPTIKLLKFSPNWKPGTNGGRLLHSYRTLRIDVLIDKQKNLKSIKRSQNSYWRDNDRNM